MPNNQSRRWLNHLRYAGGESSKGRRTKSREKIVAAALRDNFWSRLILEPLENRTLLSGTVYTPSPEPGTLTLTTPLNLQPADTLQIELGGTTAGVNYDQVNVTGGKSATFAGTLSVSTINSYVPPIGTTFQVVTSTGTSGEFTTLNLPTFANGERLVPIISPGGLTLVAAAQSAPTGQSQLQVATADISKVAGFLGLPTAAGITLNNASLDVLGQTVTGNFTLAAGITSTNKTPVIALSANNVSATFGNGLLTLSNGSGTFFLTQNGVVGSASATLNLESGLPVGFSGTAVLEVNTTSVAFNDSLTPAGGATLSVNEPLGPYFRVEADNASLTVGSQTVTAGAIFLESATVIQNTLPVNVIRAGASNVSAFIGANGVGVQLSNGTGGFELYPSGVAAQFSGNVALVGTPAGLSISGAFNVGINNTGLAVNDTFTTSNGQSVTVNFSNTGTGTVQQFGGALNLQIANFVSASGTFDIQNSSVVAGSPSTLLIGASNVNAFFGAGLGQANPTGIQISGGTLGLALLPKVNNVTPYALTASGTASLLGVPGLGLSGTLSFRKNTTGAPFDQTIDGVEIKFVQGEENLSAIGGHLSLQIANSASLTGDFGFTSTSNTSGTATTTQLQVGAANVSAFLGSADGTGVSFSNGTLGLLVNNTVDTSLTTQAASTYALDASGAASLNLPGVSLLSAAGATLEVRRNTTGTAISNQSINVPIAGGGTQAVTLNFPDASSETFVGGTLNLGIGGFNIQGGFSFSESVTTSGTNTTTKILVGATGVAAGLLVNGLGLELTAGQLGLAVYDVAPTSGGSSTAAQKSYALDAKGTVQLVGLPVTAGGTLELRLNTTGGAVNESLQVPNPAGGADLTQALTFAATDPISQFQGTGISFGVANVFTISGNLTVSQAQTGGAITIVAANPAIAFYVNGSQALTLGATASATFTLGGVDANNQPMGLHLVSFGVGGFNFSPGGAISNSNSSGGSSSSGSNSSSGTTAPAPVTPPVTQGTTLGPLTISNPSISVKNFNLGQLVSSATSGSTYPLSVEVDISIGSAKLTAGPVTANATNISGSFGVGLNLATQAPYISDPSLTGQWGLTVGHIDVNVGSFLTLSANNLALNPAAVGTSSDFLSFGSVGAQLNAGPLSISGTASNFAISGQGAFVAHTGFGVDLMLNQSQGSALKLPAYLPIPTVDVDVTWPNFSQDPTNFQLVVNQFSANISIGGTSLGVTLEGLVFNAQRLEEGLNPVTSIGTVAGNVQTSLFGLNFSGGFIGGLANFDAQGNLLGPTSNATPAQSVFWLGLSGGLSLPDIGTVTLRVGFSDLGPLNAYIEYSGQVGLPLGDTSLVISGLYGSVDFDSAPLPAVTDPRQLLSPAFATQSQISQATWDTNLQEDLYRQVEGKLNPTYLFELSSADASTLDAGGTIPISTSSGIGGEFFTDGVNLLSANPQAPKTAQVTVEDPGNEWLIQQGSALYLVQKDSQGLSVSQDLLTLPGTDAGELGTGGTSPQDVLQAFETAGLTPAATTSATITVTTPGVEWEYDDGTTQYDLTLRDKVLAVTGHGSLATLSKTVRIEAGATITDEAIPQGLFNSQAAIIITTAGQFAITATINAAGQSYHDVFYADWSHSANRPGSSAGTTPTTSFDLLLQLPVPSPIPLTTATEQIYGAVTLTPGTANTPYDVHITGGFEYDIGLPTAVASAVTGGKPLESLVFDAVIDMKISSTDFQLSGFGALSLTGLVNVPNFVTAGAYFDISSSGVYGAVDVNFDPENPQSQLSELEKIGLIADGTGYLEINTTNSASPTFNLPVSQDASNNIITKATTVAADTFDVYIAGTLQFKPGGVDLVDITGAFSLQISNTGLDLFALGVWHTPDPLWPTFDVAGAVIINSQGFAASLSLTESIGIQGIFASTGTYNLDINTTGQDQTYQLPAALVSWINTYASTINISTTGLIDPSTGQLEQGTFGHLQSGTITISGGAPVPAWDAAVIPTPGAYFVFSGTSDLTIANFQLAQAEFYVGVTAAGFSFDFKADANLGPFGGASAQGVILVNSAGVIADASLSGDLKLGSVLDLHGNALLEINTTGHSSTTTPDNIPARTAEIAITGSLGIDNSFSLQGSFFLYVSTTTGDRFDLSVNASLNFFDISPLSVSAMAEVRNDGSFYLDTTFNIDTGTYTLKRGLLSVGLGGNVEVTLDTRSSNYEVSFDNVHADLGVLDISGSAFVQVIGGVFRMEVSVAGSIFGGIASVQGTIFFSSEGEFLISLSGSLNLGGDGFGIFGNIGLTISNFDNNGILPFGDGYKNLYVDGYVNGKIEAFGITLVGVDAEVTYDGADNGALHVAAGFTVLGIHATAHFTIGHLAILDIPPELAFLSGGTLELAVGNLSAPRLFDSIYTDENYVIDQRNGNLLIKAFGETTSIPVSSVTSIAGDFGTGLDSLNVTSNVTVPINVSFEGDNAIIDDEGTGAATISATGNGDQITIGSANTGIATITAGTNAQITVAGSNSSLPTTRPTSGTDKRPTITAGAGSLVDVRNAPYGVIVNVNGGNATVYGSAYDDDLTNTATGNSAAFLYGGGGGNDKLTDEGTGNSLLTSRTPGGGLGTGSLTIIGGGGGDTIQGGTGNNSITAGNGNNSISTYGGNDTITAGGGNNLLTLGNGNETVTVGNGNNTIFGGTGQNTITAGTGHDVIHAGNGANNIVNAFASATLLDGGTTNGSSSGTTHSRLILDYSAVDSSGVNVNLDASTFKNFASVALKFGNGSDTLNLTGALTTPLTITAGNGNDTFNLSDTSTTAVSITAGNGNDSFNVNGAAAPLTVIAGTGTDSVNINGLTGTASSITLGNSASAENGGDQINITASSVPLSVAILGSVPATNARDTLNINLSGDSVPLVGTLSATNIGGLGLNGVSYSGFQAINVNLGAGSDALNVSSTVAGAQTTINGDGGNDVITVNGSIAGPTTVNADTLDLPLPATRPLPSPLYGNLTETVNTLIVDDSQGPASDQLALTDRVATLNGNTVVNAFGATTVRFGGPTGSALTNPLTVSSSSSAPTTAKVQGDGATITQGFQTLTQSSTQSSSALWTQAGQAGSFASSVVVGSKSVYLGSMLYAVDTTHGTIVTYWYISTLAKYFNGEGSLTAVNVFQDSTRKIVSIAPSADGNYLYAITDQNEVWRLKIESVSFPTFSGATGINLNTCYAPVKDSTDFHSTSAIAGIQQLRVGPDGKVYVTSSSSTAGTVQVFNADLSQATNITGGSFGQAQDVTFFGSSMVYVSGSQGVQEFTQAGNGSWTAGTFIASSGAGTLAVISNRSQYYAQYANYSDSDLVVARPNSAAIDLYHIDFYSGNLTYLQTFQNGVNGVTGLGGVDSFASGPTDTDTSTSYYLVASGKTDNSLVVFFWDASDSLTPVSRYTQGFGGISNLASPTGLYFDASNSLLIASTAGNTSGTGTLDIFDVLDPGTPVTYHVSYSAVPSLAVNLGGGQNTVTVGSTDASTVMVSPGSGGAQVTLTNSGGGTASGQRTVLNLGSASNRVDVEGTLSGSTVVINGGSGNTAGDSVNIWSTGTNSKIVAVGGHGPDVYYVQTAKLGSSSNVNIVAYGVPAGDTTPPYQTLNTDSVSVTPGQGTISNLGVAGNATLAYQSIEKSGNLNLHPSAGGPYTLAEGQTQAITLSGSGQGSGTLTYYWDLTGSGLFADLAGQNPTLNWATLTAAGISTSGVYTIAVLVKDGSGNQQIASTIINVTHPVPALSVTGASTAQTTAPYSLTLSGTEFGTDRITSWTVNWGDGSAAQTFAAGTTSTTAQHTYASTGGYTIQATATDQYGNHQTGSYNWTPTSPLVVTVSAPAAVGPTTRTISAASTVAEGAVYTLGLATSGPGINGLTGWVINWGDGNIQNVSGAPATVTHIYSTVGSYTISATTVESGVSRAADNSVNVQVTPVAPILHVTDPNGNTPASTTGEGAAYSLMLSATEQGDGLVTSWQVNWQDGSTNTYSSPNGTAVTVSHAYFGVGLNFTPSISATDQYGTYMTSAQQITVQDLPPAVNAHLSASTINQGSAAVLALSVVDLAGTHLIDQWTINWGDGTTTTDSTTPILDNNSNITGYVADVTVSHVYANGSTTPYTIQATAERAGTNGATLYAAAPVTITVTPSSSGTTTNSVPALTGTLIPPVAVEGIALQNIPVYHFTDASQTAALGDYTAVVTLGDGNQVTLTAAPGPNGQIVANAGGGYDVQLSYTYARALTNQVFAVSVTSTDTATVSTSTYTPVSQYTLGTASPVTGDTALTLNGTGGYVSVPPAAISSSGSGAFEAWVNLNRSGEQTILSTAFNGIGSVWSVGYYLNSGGHIVAGTPGKLYFSTTNGTSASSSAILTPGDYYYAAVIFSPSSVSFYINGQLDSSTSGNFTTTSTGLSQIGAWTFNNAPSFNGSIADFAIYNTALTADQVIAHYSAAVSGVDAYQSQVLSDSPQAFYPLDEAGGVAAVDLSQNVLAGSYVPMQTQGGFNVADAALNAGALTPPTATATIFVPFTTVFHFTTADPNATGSLYTATVNTGDATVTTTANPNEVRVVADPTGGFDVQLAYTYNLPLVNQRFSVSVSRGTNTASANGTITVAGHQLTAGALTVPTVPALASFSTVVFHFTDVDSNAVAGNYLATVHTGDAVLTSSGNPSAVQVVADSNGGFDVRLSYTYAAPLSSQTFSVQVQATDGQSISASSTISVVSDALTGGSAGTINISSSTAAVTSSSLSGTFTDTNQSLTAGAFSALINWGDNTSTYGTVTGSNGTFNIAGSHQYAASGQYAVSVRITDGFADSATLTGSATVADAPLTAVSASATSSTKALSASQLTAVFTSANPGELASGFTATINWGNGTTTTGTVGGSNGTYVVNAAYAYNSVGSFPVGVTVKRADGSTLTLSTTALVGDPILTAGTISVTGSTAGVSGSTSQLAASFTDANPGALSTDFTALINWGDGLTSLGTVSGSGGSYSITGGHAYTDTGNYSVGVTISDAGGSSTALNSTAIVGDATITSGAVNISTGIQSIQTSNLTASFSDTFPGAKASDFTAQITWGDGSYSYGSITAISGPGGSFSVVSSHQYTKAANYPVSVKVLHNRGSSLTLSGSAIVNEASPSFSALASPTITYGKSTTTLTGHLAAGSVYPTGSSVSITINGVTQDATVDGSGNFTTNFSTATLSVAGSPYTITYHFADNSNFAATTDTSTKLAVTQAAATVSVAPYDVIYSASSHSATGTATGVGGAVLTAGDLILTGTTHTIAGSYTDTWKFHDASGNYADASGTVSDIIALANSTVTITANGGTYTGLGIGATATVAGVSGTATTLESVAPTVLYYTGSTASGTGSSTAPVNAGTYTVVASFAGSADYTGSSASKTFTIGQATPTISVTDTGGVFNGLPFAATGTTTGVNGTNLGSPYYEYFLASDTTFSHPGTTAPTNVGSYVAIGFSQANPNYIQVGQAAYFNITPAASSVSVSDAGGTYNTSPFPAIGSVTGAAGLSTTPTFSYTGTGSTVYAATSTAPTNAGTYAVTASYAGDANHTSNSTTVNFTIAKAASSVTVSTKGGTYNGLPFAASGTVSGVALSTTPTFTYVGTGSTVYAASSTAPTNAGTYSVTASYAGDANHTGNSATATFTIAQATLSISVSDTGGVYNTLPYAATGTTTGVNGTSLGSPTYRYYISSDTSFSNPTTTAPTNVGSYVLIALSPVNSNYIQVGQAIYFSITQAASVLTPVATTVTYGGSTTLSTTLKTTGGALLAGRTVTFSVNGKVIGTAVTNSSGVASLADSVAGITPGVYASGIAVSFAGDGNSTATSATAALTVLDAPIVSSLSVSNLLSVANVSGSFTQARTGATASDFVATVNWGDGNSQQLLVIADLLHPGQFDIILTGHVYLQLNTSFKVTVTISTVGKFGSVTGATTSYVTTIVA